MSGKSIVARGAIACFVGAAIAAIGASFDAQWLTMIVSLLLLGGFAVAVIGRLS